MIDEKKYLKLSNIFNNILKSSIVNITTISIPWLHFIRLHPILLKKYKKLSYSKFSLEYFKLIFEYKFKILASIIYQFYKCILNKNLNFWYGSKTDNEVDVLFISHLINKNQFNGEDDLYFGSMPNQLDMINKKSIVAHLTYIKNPFNNFLKYFKHSNFKKIYFSNSLDFKNEISLIQSAFKESLRLKKLRNNCEKKSIERKIFDYASNEVLLNGTITNLRLYIQIQSLIKMVNPKIIITTYEGHAWERIAFSAARSINSKIICASYQHSGCFLYSNSIKIKLSKEFNPDVILTSGSFGLEDLKIQKDLNEIEILEIGSPRGKFDLVKNEDFSNKNNCLVIPEAFPSECNHLFEFSLLSAKINPNINFIWRLHPGISFNKLKKINSKYKNLPDNIFVSNSSFEEDVMKCNWVLYRGSSAVFKAISHGLKPFYLKLLNDNPIDPLFKMRNFKKNVSDPKSFVNEMLKDINEKFHSINESKDYYREFCEKQFSKININVIERILNK